MQVIQLVNVADVHFLFIQLRFVEVLQKRDKEWILKCFKVLFSTDFQCCSGCYERIHMAKPRRLGEEEQNAGNHSSTRSAIIALSSEKTLVFPA